MKFLIPQWIFIFLVNWSIILVYSAQEIELHNWIETSPGNWPPASIPQDEFLVLHSEYTTGPLLGLKRTFFDDHQIYNNVQLSFKYWSTGEGSFSSRNGTTHLPTRDIKLESGDRWHLTTDFSNPNIGGTVLAHLKNISNEEWSNFVFMSVDEFTLALKDVQVYYTMHNVAHRINCHIVSGCDNIFDRQLPTSRLWPTPNRYVPFQFENEKDSKIEHYLEFKHSIQTNNQTHHGDFCIDFNYVAKDVPLEVKLSATDPGSIIFPTTPITSQGNSFTQKRTVCASWFTPDVATVTALFFKFNSPIYDIDNHYVSDLNLRSNDNETTLREGIYVNQLDLNSHFTNEAPNDGWSTDGSNLIFSKSLSELMHLLPNSEKNGYQYHESTLRSKWIHVPNITNGHVQVGFEIDGRNLKNARLFSHINVSLTSSAPFRTVWSSRILISTEKSLAVPYGIYFNAYYQLSLYAELNVTKITELLAQGQLTGPLELTLESFSVNDPCVLDYRTGRPVEIIGVTEFKVETCGNNEKNGLGSNVTINRSRCVRDYAKFTGSCECSGNFYGEHCQFDANSVTPTVPTPTPTPVPTPTPTSVPKDPIIALVTATIAKAEKELKTHDAIRQAQIEAELTKLKDLLKRYEQSGGQDELIGELTVHETRLRHLLA